MADQFHIIILPNITFIISAQIYIIYFGIKTSAQITVLDPKKNIQGGKQNISPGAGAIG